MTYASVSAEIFRAYDIRGIVDLTLTADTVLALGQAIGTKNILYNIKNLDNKVIVARDGRLSSDRLIKLLKQGIRATGCDVIDLGLVPTPVLYFATHHLDISAAVMLTASHNPASYNGMKIILQGQALYGAQILELQDLIIEQRLLLVEQAALGREYYLDLQAEYINCVSNNVNILYDNIKPIKVVIDCGNGAAAVIAEKLLGNFLGVTVIPLYCEVDGNFPNHHPDPMVPENLNALIHTVLSNNADLGLAFDGDGDRLGVVDNRGNIIWPDKYFMLFIRAVFEDIAKNHSHTNSVKPTVIYDIKSTNQLEKFILQSGGLPLLWKTGHSVIKAKMLETNALLAAEMSGHIFFKDRWFGFDDALYTAVRLLEILSRSSKSLAELCENLPISIATPEFRIAASESSKHIIVHNLINLVSSSTDDAKINTIDGLRLEFANSWGVVRASNTTPNIIARFEGIDFVHLNAVQNFFKQKLLQVAPELILPF